MTKKKRKSAADYSKDEFLNNPVASAQDCTGIAQTVPETSDEAKSISRLGNIPSSAQDGAQTHGKAR